MTSLPVPRLRPLSLLASLLLLLALGACTAQRLAYENADWLLKRTLDRYLDLDGEQEARAADMLAVAHREHREVLLPRFAATFASAREQVERGLTEADLWALWQQAELLLSQSVEGLLPAVSRSLVGLSPAQHEHLARRLEERNEDYVERRRLDRPAEERLRRRAERTVERIEDWTGPLNDEQVALITRHRNAMPDDAGAWLERSRAMQHALLERLRNGAPREDIEALLRQWWLFRDDPGGRLAGAREERVRAFITLIVRLSHTLDSVQREHLVDRLDDLARDAHELARAA